MLQSAKSRTRCLNEALFTAVRNVCFWHKADMSGSALLPCKLIPEPHFAGSKSLL